MPTIPPTRVEYVRAVCVSEFGVDPISYRINTDYNSLTQSDWI